MEKIDSMAYSRGWNDAVNKTGWLNPYEPYAENFRQYAKGYREGREHEAAVAELREQGVIKDELK